MYVILTSFGQKQDYARDTYSWQASLDPADHFYPDLSCYPDVHSYPDVGSGDSGPGVGQRTGTDATHGLAHLGGIRM